ncbi:putative sugar O-methyltransferase [Thermodesulfobacteriota bacterium]
MDFGTRARYLLNSKLKRYKLISSSSLYDWQKYPQSKPSYKESITPEGVEDYLQPNHPRLKELQKRYANFDSEVTVPLVWKEGIIRPEDLRYFRGDNAYVWQLRGLNMNIMAYALTTYYVKSIDKLGLLQQLEEDDYFGNFTFLIDNKKISRDLLDSINEIYFLDKHLNVSSLSGLNILDIGAGYGRLAHRMVGAFPNIQTYYCTDAVAISTFISEHYIRFRKLENNTKVIPLDDIESTLKKNTVDIAVNIHSFSECSISAIEWWLSLLEKYGVKYLMIVPNAGGYGDELLLSNDRQDISKVAENHGYRLIVKEFKYSDPVVQKYAISPTCYYLFKLF